MGCFPTGFWNADEDGVNFDWCNLFIIVRFAKKEKKKKKEKKEKNITYRKFN